MLHRILDLLGVFSAACWPVCFWWMHRISKQQNAMLANLAREAETVSKLSKEEHAMLRQLEPKIVQVAEKVS